MVSRGEASFVLCLRMVKEVENSLKIIVELSDEQNAGSAAGSGIPADRLAGVRSQGPPLQCHDAFLSSDF
jgi:hypothetical protein